MKNSFAALQVLKSIFGYSRILPVSPGRSFSIRPFFMERNKNLKLQLMLSGILVMLPFVGNSQPPKDQLQNTLLWEISGNGLKKTSYLYGTVHMMCQKDFIISEKVLLAFANTNKLALELDFDDPKELQQMQKMTEASKPLSELMTAREYQDLNAFLLHKLGMGADKFEKTSLTMIMSAVMFKNLNCPPKMFELEFLKMAMARKLEVVGLEKVEVQMDAMNKAYDNSEYLEQMKFYDHDFFVTMTQSYKNEKLMELYNTLTDEKIMDSNAKSLMLEDRNKKWVEAMPRLMGEEAVFFAFGAAHLPGENGVINLLVKAGYNVRPVLN